MKQLIAVLFGELELVVLIPTLLLLLSGIVSFGLFISEEALQAVSFAAYGYVNAKDIDGLREHLVMMRFIDRSCSAYIKFVGWMSPLMYPAYLNYLSAFRSQLRQYERKVELEKNSHKTVSVGGVLPTASQPNYQRRR